MNLPWVVCVHAAGSHLPLQHPVSCCNLLLGQYIYLHLQWISPLLLFSFLSSCALEWCSVSSWFLHCPEGTLGTPESQDWQLGFFLQLSASCSQSLLCSPTHACPQWPQFTTYLLCSRAPAVRVCCQDSPDHRGENPYVTKYIPTICSSFWGSRARVSGVSGGFLSWPLFRLLCMHQVFFFFFLRLAPSHWMCQ